MLNNCNFMGRLTADPELKTTASGVNVARFTIAVERDAKTKEGEKQTDFIPCVAWQKTGEFVANYFGKGKMIAVAGELQSRKYTDKDGNNRIAYEINVNRAYFCGSATDQKEDAAPQDVQSFPKHSVADDDSLPF